MGTIAYCHGDTFDENLDVDYDKLWSLPKIIDDGSTAIVVVGTTGESPTLTSEESMSYLGY